MDFGTQTGARCDGSSDDWSGHVGLDVRQADVDPGGVDTSLNAERASGYVLLVAAVTGAALGAKAPQRWGRAGGGLLLAGLSALLARDVAMIASGTPRRLRSLPRALLLAETVCAGMGIAVGAQAWLGAGNRHLHDPRNPSGDLPQPRPRPIRTAHPLFSS